MINKDRKFCKSSKCLDSEAMLRWKVARKEFLFILSLLKLLMSWYMESIEKGWSKSLKGVPTNYTEVRNSRVTKSSYKIKLRKMMSHFKLLIWKFVEKFFFQVTDSVSVNFILSYSLEVEKWKFHFELLNRSWKRKSSTSSYLLDVTYSKFHSSY